VKSFEDLDIKKFYSAESGYNDPLEFYCTVFPHSQDIYIRLGYFTSFSISILAKPLTEFLLSKGTLYIITNHYLSENDILNLVDYDISEKHYESIGMVFKKDIETFSSYLKKGSNLFYDCINYLQKEGRLVIKPVFFTNYKRNAHLKECICFDGRVYISTNGSCNLTANGLIYNAESFTTDKSWTNSNEHLDHILDRIERFKDILNDDQHFEFPKAPKELLLEHIEKASSENELDELLEKGKELDKELKIIFEKKKKKIDFLTSKSLEESITKYKSSPRFPYPKPYSYQVQAYEEWMKNNYKGLFAMATGTGKTLTSIYCLIQEYEKNKIQRNIFIVPGKELVNQWYTELRECNFKNIYKWYSGNNSLTKEIESIKILKQSNSLNIVITYSSFTSNRFLNIFREVLKKFTIIFDEAHNIGAPKFKESIRDISLDRVIGLSATPLRLWDDNNENQFIEKLLHTQPPYTFSYPMELAIKNKFLVPYFYFPKFTYTNDEEFEEYLYWTSRLFKYEDGKRVLDSNAAINRQQVLDRAIRKEDTLINVIQELINKNDQKFTLVYCSKGNDEFGERRIHTLGEKVANLFKDLNIQFFLGETKDRELLLEDFESGLVDMLFAIKCLDEGVNVPRTQNAIFLASGKNYREFVQRRGRVLRKYEQNGIKKNHANIYDIIVFPTLDQFRNNRSIGKRFIANEFKRIYEFNKLSKEREKSFRLIDNELKRYGLSQYYLEKLLEEDD